MNIFIIEDERYALEELRLLMGRYEPLHQIYAFKTGYEACKHAQRIVPDIVVTDIRMPGIDGLETIRRLKESYPLIEAIVISGYKDFDYARKGLLMGIKDYLLKPVRLADLYAVMDQSLETVMRENDQEQKLTDSMLVELLIGTKDNGLDRPQSVLKGQWCLFMLLLGNWNSSRQWQEVSLPLKEMAEGLKKRFGEKAKLVQLDGKRRVVLLPSHEFTTQAALNHAAFSIHQSLTDLGERVHLAFDMKMNDEPLHHVYSRVMINLEKHIKIGESTFISPDYASQACDLSGLWDKARLLEAHIIEGDYARIKLAVHRILEELQERRLGFSELSLFINDILNALKFNLHHKAATKTAIDIGDLTAELKKIDDYKQMEGWFEDKLSLLIHLRDTDNALTPKKLIPALMELVQSAYGQELSLMEFAAAHHINSSYLSRLFKAETGIGFSEYLIQFRMKKAQELLASGYEKTSVVSGLVGYEDAKYFSQMFKKVTGSTPTDYLKSLRSAK